MASKEFSTFEAFWQAISPSIISRNCPTYHPCCRVWVGRFQRACRDSHIQVVSWRAALRPLSSPGTSLKDSLLAHMIENQWGTPIHLDARCSAVAAPAALNRALQNQEAPPALQAFPNAFQFHTQPPAPTSPRSSPAQLQDLPPQTQPQLAAASNPPRPLLETESRAINQSLQQSLQQLQDQQALVQQDIKQINQAVESSQQLAMQNQLALSTALVQITSVLTQMQVRLDSLEKQAQTPARLTPCITEMRNLEYACQQVISQAKKERDEMAARAEDIERSHSRMFKTNQSLASRSEKQAQELADSRSEVARLQRDLQTREEQYNLLKALTDPLLRRAESANTERQQRQRGAQLAQPNLGLLSAVQHDGYKIKKLPEATKKWHN